MRFVPSPCGVLRAAGQTQAPPAARYDNLDTTCHRTPAPGMAKTGYRLSGHVANDWILTVWTFCHSLDTVSCHVATDGIRLWPCGHRRDTVSGHVATDGIRLLPCSHRRDTSLAM